MSSNQAEFYEHLLRHRDKIVNKWLDAAIATYPSDSAHFLKHQKDEFANPVGASLERDLNSIFDELLKESSSPRLAEYVDAIMRARAVQDFSPSGAVRVLSLLKDVLRTELDGVVRARGWQAEYRTLEDKVDQLCMLGFDIYVRCRERLWEIRAREIQNRSSYLLRKFAGVRFSSPTREDESVENEERD